jgi:hypothetical protein
MSVGTLESLENQLAGRLAGRLASHVQAPNLPSAAQVVSWMDLVDLCCELDENLVLAESPTQDLLAIHKVILNLAIGCGGWLIHQIRSRGMDISTSGQTLDVLDGSLELLRILHRTRHSELPPAEIAAAQRRIFNAAA